MTISRYELKNEISASNELENIVMWSSTVTRHKSSSHSDFKMLFFLNFYLVLRQMCLIGEVLEKYYTRPQSWRVTAMSQVGGARCYRGNVYHTASYCCHDGIVCLFVYHRAAMIPLRPVLPKGSWAEGCWEGITPDGSWDEKSFTP